MNKKFTKIVEYLESINVSEETITEIRDNVKEVITLQLPTVCIVSKNRVKPAGKQTHIHVTGDRMSFFYSKEQLEKKDSSLGDDIKLDLIVFENNIKNLSDAKGLSSEKLKELEYPVVSSENESYTMKKVGRLSSPSIQVQISKLRMDDSKFIEIRNGLYEHDYLVFIKTENTNRVYVLGIPQAYDDDFVVGNYYEEFFNEVEMQTDIFNAPKISKNLRNVDYGSIASYTSTDESDEVDPQTFDLSSGIAVRKKRTERHQEIVKMLARDLERASYALFENPIDCLATKDGSDTLLFEIKTLDGTVADERKQVVKAFSQVCYYEKFHLSEETKSNVKKIVLFEKKISDEHVDFLDEFNIEVMWIEGTEFKNKYGTVNY